MIRRVFVTLISLFLLTAPLAAQDSQNVAKGFAPDKLFQFNDLDHISTFNGNVNVVIPIGQTYHAASTLPYQLMLTYSGDNWEYYGNMVEIPDGNGGTTTFTLEFAEPSTVANAGVGWWLSLGRLDIDPVGLYRYTAPDGSQHSFLQRLHNRSQEPVDPNVFYTCDSSYLRLKLDVADNDPQQTTCDDIEFPDGTIQRFEASTMRLRKILDRFGNAVTITYDTYLSDPNNSSSPQWPRWTITDGTGRTHYIKFRTMTTTPIYVPSGTQIGGDPASFDVISSIDLAGFGGARSVYTFVYRNDAPVRISRQYARTQDPNVPPGINLPILDHVVLPDGSQYVATMDMGDGGLTYSDPENSTATSTTTPGFSGHLTSLILPTLGKIEWQLGRWIYPATLRTGGPGPTGPGPSGSAASLVRSVGVRTRLERDANGTVLTKRTYDSLGLADENTTKTGMTTVTTWDGFATDGSAGAPFSKSVSYYTLPNNHDPFPGEYALPFTRNTSDPDAATPVATTDSGGRHLSTKQYDGSGHLLGYSYVSYEGDTPAMDDETWANRRMVSERSVNRDATGTTDVDSRVTSHSDFDGLGHYRIEVEDGDAAGTPRTTVTNFNRPDTDADSSVRDVGTWGVNFHMLGSADKWLLNFISSKVVSESQSAKTLVCFDSTTGFMTRSRTLAVSTAPSANDLIARYTQSGGNATDEEYFGGDTQSVLTTPLCNSSIVTSGSAQYHLRNTWQSGSKRTSRYVDASGNPTTSYLSLDTDVDLNTGLVSAARTAAGIATSYNYDASGRLSQTSPTGTQPTIYSYTRATNAGSFLPAQVDIRMTSADAGHTYGSIESQYQFDALGRVWRQKQLMPDNSWSLIETLYAGSGLKSSESGKEQIVGSEFSFHPVKPRTTYTYDGLGRVTMTTLPDGKATSVAYTGSVATTRTSKIATDFGVETNVSTSEAYDRHGRLASVTESSGIGGANVTTTYSYDVGDRLFSATTVDTSMNQTITQQRLFQYDNRGFLVWERHPEKGAAGNGMVCYGILTGSTCTPLYDSRGHVRRRIDGTSEGGFDLTYQYDAGERPTEVDEIDPGSTSSPRGRRVSKLFFYGTSNGSTTICPGQSSPCTDYTNGNLIRSIRQNYFTGAFSMYPVIEMMHYSGRGGRLSAVDTEADLGPAAASAETTAVYNDLGQPVTLGYPVCTVGCTGIHTAPTVTSDYRNGSLVSMPSYVSGITYQPNGQLATVVHANGTTESWLPDPDGIARPCALLVYGSGSTVTGSGCNQTPVGGSVSWSSGQYTYDGSGNIKAIGSGKSYAYDAVGRLAKSTENGITNPYYYDAFGNLSTPASDVQQGDIIAHVFASVDPLTNHLVSATYDDAGNVTTDTPAPGQTATFTWGAVGTMSTLTDAARSMLYLYDADDERIGTIDNSTGIPAVTYTFRGRGHELLSSYTRSTAGAWTWKEDEVWRGNVLAATLLPNGGTLALRHHAVDHLGSPRVETESTGALAGTQDFTPFGYGGATGTSVLQFTGHERDWAPVGANPATETLDYMHARYYDSQAGRFTSPDSPRYADSTDPQTLNLYTYVRDNPLVKIDPDGNNWFDINGQWEWHAGNTYTHADANGKDVVSKSNYEYLLQFQKTGTNEYGAAVGTLTLFGNDHGKAVASADVFSGGNGHDAIPNGQYMLRLDIRGTASGPADLKANGRELAPFFGTQDVASAIQMPGGGLGNARWEWGSIRMSLNHADNGDDRFLGNYLHGKERPGNWTHGCICNRTENILHELRNLDPASVPRVPVVVK